MGRREREHVHVHVLHDFVLEAGEGAPLGREAPPEAVGAQREVTARTRQQQGTVISIDCLGPVP